ncbi:MAG: DegT/DnrJ/EryC1/StrS family aminotransferase [archaeon]
MRRIIRISKIEMGDEEREGILDVLNSGWISESSPKIREFEKSWAKYIGTKQSILTNSGTSALIAGLQALKIKYDIPNGKKVITTPVTYIATSNAIVLSNLEPVYCDVDREKFLIQPEGIEKLLEKNPEEYCGILPVHLMGYACDMDAINSIAKKHGLFVFEDAAQAHGTKYNGKIVGSLGDISDFSFYIAHNIQVGELGAVNSNDPELIRLIRKIKANGRLCDCTICTRSQGTCPKMNEDYDPRFKHDIIGYNFKTTAFQAALALAQFGKIDEIIKKRSNNVKYLNENLKHHSGLQFPIYDENVSYLAYPIITENRMHIRQELEKQGIETRTLFECIPTQQPAYSKYAKSYKGKLPNAEYIGTNGFYIGCHQYLEKEDLEYVVETFDNILGGKQ